MAPRRRCEAFCGAIAFSAAHEQRRDVRKGALAFSDVVRGLRVRATTSEADQRVIILKNLVNTPKESTEY